MNAVLIDTNVLVYQLDGSAPEKLARATDVVRALGSSGVLSAQVLSEFYSVVRRKFSHTVTLEETREGLEALGRSLEVIPVTFEVVREAVRGVEEHGLSFYDAQIWAVAKLNGIPIVLSEDFTHGRIVEGVRYVDPFCPQFDMAELG